jgi:1-acyl-sn-glycerol-3-phosphate acyltransferase
MTPRELARQALSSLTAAANGLTQDHMILLLYPEGSRTRDGHLGSFLKGVHRYLSTVEDMSVVPMTVEGTDHLMSVDNDERIVPSAIQVRFLPALRVGADGSPRDILAQVHGRIGAALAPNHRPKSGTPALI